MIKSIGYRIFEKETNYIQNILLMNIKTNITL